VKEISFDLPAMYGDHHVTEVRRLLLELPGVQEVYASSSFHVVEVQFDETKLGSQKIEQTLSEAGYLGELPVPVEMGALAERENGDKPFFRHTAVFENTGHTVSFGQQVPFAGRPLWPCPGMGPLTQNLDESEEEKEYG
jgi:copper chaperone CopZ